MNSAILGALDSRFRIAGAGGMMGYFKPILTLIKASSEISERWKERYLAKDCLPALNGLHRSGP